MQSFSKASVFAVHTAIRKQHFQMYPLWRSFSKSSVFLEQKRQNVKKKMHFQTKKRISVDMASVGQRNIWHRTAVMKEGEELSPNFWNQVTTPSLALMVFFQHFGNLPHLPGADFPPGSGGKSAVK